MTTFDVVLLPFPFTDLSATKQRPGLILARVEPRGLPVHYVIAMITSQLSGSPFPADTAIRHFAAAGLPKPSLARLSKVVTIEETLVRRKLGRLNVADQITISSHFGQLYKAVLKP